MPGVWTEVQAEYACDHDLTEIRRRIDSLGRAHAVRQCVHCGQNRGNVSKATMSAAAFDALPAYDEDHADRYLQEMRAESARRFEAGRFERKQDYSRYLESPEWRQKRRLVLERDNHVCRGCLTNRATEVHHLTYAHRGHEYCFELVSLCRPCHEALSLDDQVEVS